MDFCELGLYDVQLLLVLQISFPEPVRELLGFLTVKTLVVLRVLLFLGKNLLCSQLQLFSLHFCQLNSVLQLLSIFIGCISVRQVLGRHLVIRVLPCLQSLLEGYDLVSVVFLFKIELLLSNDTVLLIASDCLLKQVLLPRECLYKHISFVAQSVDVLMGKNYCLNDT